MEKRIKRIYIPMTETGFYILYCLRREQHGYGISQQVKKITEGEVVISPGTMYGTLSKMERDGLIAFVREEEKRKIYCITELGRQVLDIEIRRIERLYKNTHQDRL
jgi:DNA-binding PadR family transcriptional regulator